MHRHGKCNSGLSICSDMGRLTLAALTFLLASYPVRAQQQISGSAAIAEAPIPTLFRNYEPVSAERLKNPEPANWLQIRGNYAGWGYSELDQITRRNVTKLQLAWVFSTGAVNAHEAAPLVNNGVMYVSSPGNQVFAINAKTGTLLWLIAGRYLPARLSCIQSVVASHGSLIKFSSVLMLQCLWCLTRRPGKKCGLLPWKTTKRATT